MLRNGQTTNSFYPFQVIPPKTRQEMVNGEDVKAGKQDDQALGKQDAQALKNTRGTSQWWNSAMTWRNRNSKPFQTERHYRVTQIGKERQKPRQTYRE